MKRLVSLTVLCTGILMGSGIETFAENTNDIVIENDQMRLVISSDGTAQSLVHKPTQTECLVQGERVAISTITEPRPYQNEVKLAYPNKRTTFKSNAVRKAGNKLILGYELIPWEATVGVKVARDYLAFTLEAFTLRESYGIEMTEPPISEMCFLRLPVRNLGHWGDWLNVVWDEKVAVNVLAAQAEANVDSEEGHGYRILEAGVDEKVKLTGVTAALITCATDQLLDHIAVVEEDYQLPHGVASRRHELYTASYYWTANINPGNVDEHIKYAKLGGFRLMNIYYPAFLESRGYRLIGNYDVYGPQYPNGKADLKAMLARIKAAGIRPGCHFLHSHIGRDSKYVTPIPDRRLNLVRIFTLAKPLGTNDTTIFVDQNPANSTMADKRRVLKLGTELISYATYTTTPPYAFQGCVRGIDKTTVNAQPAGYLFGLLDVSEFGATSVYLDQNSDLQDEVADGIADIWDAGFEFLYFDGSEGVNAPFWYHVSGAQYRVYKKLKPEPVFAEGAAKTHFGWHLLTGGNAFDVFSPETLKEQTLKHPFRQAPRMRDNFTRLNFGWLGYRLPGTDTIGTQPDQLEFVTSKAAAWDCPVSIHADPNTLARHPRTADNFEVFRRWEEVRARRWLTEEQKLRLRKPDQEFTLLLNEKNDFELVACDKIAGAAKDAREVIAFTFERNNQAHAVYWHTYGKKELELPIKPGNLTLMESIGQEAHVKPGPNGATTVLPVSNRRYVKAHNMSRNELIAAFQNAKVLESQSSFENGN